MNLNVIPWLLSQSTKGMIFKEFRSSYFNVNTSPFRGIYSYTVSLNLVHLLCYIGWLVEIMKSWSCIFNYSRILYTSVANISSEIVFKTLLVFHSEIVYTKQEFSWLCLVHSGKFRDDISNQTTIAPFRFISNPFSTIHPTIRSYAVWNSDGVLNRTQINEGVLESWIEAPSVLLPDSGWLWAAIKHWLLHLLRNETSLKVAKESGWARVRADVVSWRKHKSCGPDLCQLLHWLSYPWRSWTELSSGFRPLAWLSISWCRRVRLIHFQPCWSCETIHRRKRLVIFMRDMTVLHKIPIDSVLIIPLFCL
jgi:hypothetical protein